jgi:hypothetical protein
LFAVQWGKKKLNLEYVASWTRKAFDQIPSKNLKIGMSNATVMQTWHFLLFWLLSQYFNTVHVFEKEDLAQV